MRPRRDDRQAVPQIPGDDGCRGGQPRGARPHARATVSSAAETACHAGRPYVEQCCKRAADTALTRVKKAALPGRAGRIVRSARLPFSKARARHLACEIASKCSDAQRAVPRFLRSVGLRRRRDPDYRRTSRLGAGRASRIKPAARSAIVPKPARSSCGSSPVNDRARSISRSTLAVPACADPRQQQAELGDGRREAARVINSPSRRASVEATVR